MMPLCRAEKIASTPYSPLASGRLARDLAETTTRYETDPVAKSKYDASAESDKVVIARLAEVAQKHGVPRAHVSLAWLLQKAPVVAPVIGATKLTQLESAVESLATKLTPEEVAFLEEPYVAHPIVGHN
jgi:aryl-alcohol dehydrogenase-like predicted oxidoreductase